LALKLLHSHFVTDQLIVDRFKREAETSNLLRHPNVVEVESWAISASGQVYMTEEFVEGISLQDAIAESGWLAPELALGIAAQVASGLVAAHEMGVVHCDLKPGNIMLTRSPEGMLMVKVLDFGIAKVMPLTGDTVLRLTQSGNMQGSLLYMSPEQCLDEDLDGRSDVYSLACVIYEALTGKSPLCARTAFETMNRHLNVMPAPLATVRTDLRWPDKLEATLSRAYAKKPKDRYQSMVAFQTALKKVIDLPIEIEWPERWTARSERIEGDRKVDKTVPAPLVSAKIVGSTKPVATAQTLEPEQITEVLLGSLPVISQKESLFVLVSYIAAVITFMSFAVTEIIGSPILWPLSLILLGFGWKLWRDYSYLVNIAILKKVRFDESHDYTRRLRSRQISIIEVTKIKANYYCVTINYAVSVGSSLHEKLVVRLVTFNDLWQELEMKTSRKRRNMTEKLPTRADLPVPKLQYPLPGYLFCDSRGDKIAISIQNDVGWIFSD
jgi:serine/threonine protein kinase